MITHTIAAPKPVSLSHRVSSFFKVGNERVKYPVGSEAHKRQIYERSITNHDWKEGEYVVWRKTGATVFIMTILDKEDYDQAEWDGLKPCFIEIFGAKDEKCFLVHPSDLKEIK